MPKPKLGPNGTGKTPLSVQNFEYREVRRSTVRTDPKNPRSISPLARKRLKAKIEKVGCVEPLIWNEKLGILCGGHQRLSIMDEINHYPPADYTVKLAVVSWSAKQHAEMEIFLNNPGAQGQFERDPFLALIKGSGLKLDDIGFSKVDLEFTFGELPDIDSIFTPTKAATKPAADAIADIKDRKKTVRKQNTAAEPEQDADYMIAVCWNSQKEKSAWAQAHGLTPEIKMMSADEFFAALE
jgi:hypothetical protein